MTQSKTQLTRGLVGALLAGCMSATWALPARVIIIRNGEPPAAPKQQHDLSLKGLERAEALAPYFAELNKQNPIAAVYATRPSTVHPSHRPAETCAPTAKMLGLTLKAPYPHGDENALAQAIKTNPAYRNKTVVVCWQHGVIPALASALGVNNPPKPWPDKVFDATWVVDFAADGNAHLTVESQRLLYGDSAHPPAAMRQG